MVTAAYKRRKQLWFVLILSFCYMVAEIVGGILSGSLALLADAGHMATDVAAIGLGLFAIWIAQRPATQDKTYGYYRVEILAALVNGATLVAISLWIFFEAWQRFRNPVEVVGPLMTLVASGGLLVNMISLWITHQGSKHSLNMRGVWLHILSDALGSVSAIVAGLLVWKFGWTLADPIISVVIGLLILYSSWNLLSECVNVLLEGVPKEIDLTEVRTTLESLEHTLEVHDLHVWTLTSGFNSLSAHIRVKEGADHRTVLNDIACVLKERYGIEHVTIQLEPPDFKHPSTDLCQS